MNRKSNAQEWLDVVGGAETNVVFAASPVILSVLWSLAFANIPDDGGSSALSVALFVLSAVLTVVYVLFVLANAVFESRSGKRYGELEERYS